MTNETTPPLDDDLRMLLRGEGGRDLIAVYGDGTVVGTIEDASEAAAAFILHIRQHMGLRLPAAHQPLHDDDLRKRAAHAITWAERGEEERSVDWPGDIEDAERMVDVVLGVFEKADGPTDAERGAYWLAQLEQIVAGIDRDYCEDRTGWWETSVGAEFGARKLNELRALIRDMTGARTADVEQPKETPTDTTLARDVEIQIEGDRR